MPISICRIGDGELPRRVGHRRPGGVLRTYGILAGTRNTAMIPGARADPSTTT